MIRLYAEFDSEAEAELWRDAIYRNYPPLGYSTHITISMVAVGRGEDGVTKWAAYGSRAESCD